jgi:hypothetical protein
MDSLIDFYDFLKTQGGIFLSGDKLPPGRGFPHYTLESALDFRNSAPSPFSELESTLSSPSSSQIDDKSDDSNYSDKETVSPGNETATTTKTTVTGPDEVNEILQTLAHFRRTRSHERRRFVLVCVQNAVGPLVAVSEPLGVCVNLRI